MLNKLASLVWSEPEFQKEYTSLVKQSITSSILGDAFSTSSYSDKLCHDSLGRLLESSVILAQSNIINHREAAYRIAVAAYSLFTSRYDTVQNILFVVLSRLGNFPAIKYTLKNSQDIANKIPLSLLFESMVRRENNQVTLKDNLSEIVFTDFQRDIWTTLSSGSSLGTSAPTSAGKSFVLQAYIRNLWKAKSNKRVVYLVPTRALINQVSSELLTALKSDGFPEPEIVTVPTISPERIDEKHLFVLTQERLQLLLTTYPGLTFDLVMVDEAQAVGDGSRGVILTAVLEEMQMRNPDLQMFFASPNVSNPEIFQRLFDLADKFQFRKSREITVAQNLIHLDTLSTDLRQVKVSLNFNGQKEYLCDLKAPDEILNARSATMQLSHLIGKTGQNLIYAKGPSDCQDLASGLMQLEDPELQLTDGDTPIELQNLSDFIKDSVHPKYILAETIRRGVAFHYGSMPPLVRRSIEDEFRNGNIKFLVCTSTLLQGLNMPAKNLFLNKPEKGSNQAINSVDFWNLAGRAGRLGKEFEGNVFLINYEHWNSKPIDGVKESAIQSTLDNHLERHNELITYIKDKDRATDYKGRDEFENTFTKLFFDHRAGRIESTLRKLNIDNTSQIGIELIDAVEFASQQITLPTEVLINSPTVSVYRQQRLYNYMTKRIGEKGGEYLLPLHPLREKAYDSLCSVFKRCHNEIFQWSKSDRRHRRAAVFALPWMQGKALPEIIDSHYNYELKRNRNHTISKSIIETLDTIEDDIRFTYVKLTGCYNSLPKYALTMSGFSHLAERIVPLPLFLEVGACSQTMTSFMELGLSRITARKLTEKTNSSAMNVADVRAWLHRIDPQTFGLSPLIEKEIQRVF